MVFSQSRTMIPQPETVPNPTAALTRVRHCLPKQPGGVEVLVLTFYPFQHSLTGCWHQPQHLCAWRTRVLQGKVSSVNTGLRCSHPPLHLISSPTPQHRDVSALPAQLGEQQGIPQTTPVKGFTSGNPRLHRRNKRLQARMCYPSSFLTQALY